MSGSREVHWQNVYLFVHQWLGVPGSAPIPGTPAWTELPDDHPDKWRGLLWAAVWWAVAQDARQDALAEAGQAISGAENWADIARQVQRRREIDETRKSA